MKFNIPFFAFSVIISSILIIFIIKNFLLQDSLTNQLISGLIILTIITTYLTLSFVGKKFLFYALIGLIGIMILATFIIVALLNNNNEVIESLTSQSSCSSDPTTIGNSQVVDCTTTDTQQAQADAGSNSTVVQNTDPSDLLSFMESAQASCGLYSEYKNEYDNLTNIKDNDACGIQQGICQEIIDGAIYNGQWSTLQNECKCIVTDSTSCETENIYTESEEEKRISSEITNCVDNDALCSEYVYAEGNPNYTCFYDCDSTNFDTKCHELGGPTYGVKEIISCDDDPNCSEHCISYAGKCRALCSAGYNGGDVLDENTFYTDCYDKNVNLNDICRSVANTSNYKDFQKFGVYKYKCNNCDLKNQQRAFCKKYYYDGEPTHPINATKCMPQNETNKLQALCQKKNNDYVAFDIGAYDCNVGYVRANCDLQCNVDKMKNNKFFNNDVYA